MTITATPVVQEIAYCDPIEVFSCVNHHQWSILLDSANYAFPYQNTNRYSYIALMPFKTFVLKNGFSETYGNVDDPFIFLKEAMQHFKIEKLPELPPFQGGAVGFFAYDLCHYLEKIPYATIDDMQFPDLAVGLYDSIISFDHHKKKAWIIAAGLTANNDNELQLAATRRIQEILAILTEKNQLIQGENLVDKENEIVANFDETNYQSIVKTAQKYILNGDIFQVNLAQRFKTQLPDNLTPFALYKRLRKINPAPFAAYLNLGDVILASASPERFILVENGSVETRPIKGTVRRGNTPEEDKQLAEQLLSSGKDKSENVMIVDLMRNDLSRVCEDDSVQVEQLCGLETYATVHHLVSVIKGKLKPNTNAVDLLAATLPGGSITGAPKVRAMQIISELEPNRRGPYCGSIGYLSFSGDMDTSIVIRTYTIRDRTVTFQTGGAVVLDSDPAKEYEETLVKARALMKALRGVI